MFFSKKEIEKKQENQEIFPLNRQMDGFYAWKKVNEIKQDQSEQIQKSKQKLKSRTFLHKIKIFCIDHWHLLFKDAASNHLRIQELKSRLDSAGACSLEFESYTHLKRYQKKVRILTGSAFSTTVSICVMILMMQVFFPGSKSIGATYTWMQNSWNGGVDVITTASHDLNKTNWDKFFSKDANIAAGSDVKLAATSGSFVDTTDADFNAQAKTNVYVSGLGASGVVYALKLEGATCVNGYECRVGVCTAGVCHDPWKTSPCGVLVYETDLADAYWQTVRVICAAPQCSGGVLVSDNSVIFNVGTNTTYPARQECKDVGGRLPNLTELVCMYNNNATIGGFKTWAGSSFYWSANEKDSIGAWYKNFSSGIQASNGKNSPGYVRCVK